MTGITAAPRRAVASVQSMLGHAVRSRVAGDDADRRSQEIWGKPGERWFQPSDPVWRVHADASMFVGGVTALLLQALQPQAMAGVAGHSGYRSDPWGRLQRTSHYIAVTTYGTIPDAEETIRRVRAVHDRVRGRDESGRPYRASDPHLLTWIHTAEIWSFLRAFEAYGQRKGWSASDADTYVEQAGHAARLLGVPEPARTVAELEATLQAYRPELESTNAARDTAAFLLLSPPLAPGAKVGYWTLAAGGIALLPPWARPMLGLRMPDPVARHAGGALGRFGAASVRWALAGVEDRRSGEPRAA